MEEIKEYADYLEIGKVTKLTNTKVAGMSFDNDYKEFHFWDWKKGTYRVFTRSKFQKRFTAEGRDIMNVLSSDADIGKMHRIMRHIDSENMVIYSSHDKKAAIPATRELMLKLISGHEKRAKEFLRKIIKLGIIQEVKFPNEGEPYYRYFVSPIYTMASTGITLRLYKLFREQLIPHLTKQAINDLEALIYYELHPEKLAELKEKDIMSDSCLNDIMAPPHVEEKDLIDLRNRINIWILADSRLKSSIEPEKMNYMQLKLLEDALIDYCVDNNLEKLMLITDYSILPADNY